MIIGCSAITSIAVAGLSTERAVVNDPTQNIAASVQFSTPVKGDLYIATKVGEQYLFLNKAGQFTPERTPFSQATEYSGNIPLFNIPAKGSAPGRYPLYQVVTNPGSDPLDFNNWIGGLAGLSAINFTIGLPPEQSGDLNNDGFADNDLNKDGFYDDDLNKDGLRDTANIPEPEPVVTPEPTPQPVAPPVVTPPVTNIVAEGKAIYAGCSSSGCHGANPAFNQNNVLGARNPSVPMPVS